MQFNFVQWLPYWLLGLLGIVLHISTKLGKGETIPKWIGANNKEFWFSFIAYHVILFFWVDTGLEFFGMLKATPSGQTFLVGWFGSSMLKNVVSKFGKKLDEQEKQP